MPSEFHCPLLEDECITVRVRKEETIEPRGTHVKYSFFSLDASDLENFNPDNLGYESKFSIVEGTHFELLLESPSCWYVRDDVVAQEQASLDYFASINPERNAMNLARWDTILSGLGIPQNSSFYRGRGLYQVQYSDMQGLHIVAENQFYDRVMFFENSTTRSVYGQTGCELTEIISCNQQSYTYGYNNSQTGYGFTCGAYNTEQQPPRNTIRIYKEDGSYEDVVNINTRPTYVGLVNPSPEQTVVTFDTYKINKADYLPGIITKQLEVTDQAYNFVPRTLEPINPYLEIPRHCWNIYMTAYPLPTPYLLISTAEVQFVMQICTDDPGTFERPQLEITCGCGESCPENTCPVECTDHFCCYSSDGVSLKEIPLVDYDG